MIRFLGKYPDILSIYMLLRHDFLKQAWHDYRHVFLKSYRSIAALLPIPISEAKVLVLGCGYTYPDVILYSSIAKEVVGLDTTPTFFRDSPLNVMRKAPHGKLRQLVRASLFWPKYWTYYYWLHKVSGVRVEHQKYRLISYDGRQIPFEDETFDVVISNAVLEHVEELNAVFAEVRRVTKTGGISYHLWHNFYSFSGGHVPEFLSRKYPWGHLRGKYRVPTGVYNTPPHEVQNYFTRYFDQVTLQQVDENHNRKGIDPGFHYEQEELLSGEIANELCNYPRELLLTKSYLLTGVKTGGR